jgi:glycosyltransferase involved in cell wall biosynthesis
MGCGLPVICSRRGGLVDSCAETALYLDDPDDAEGLAAHVRALAGDESRRSERSRAVRARAETFSWPGVAGSMLGLYRELSGPGA